MDKSDRIPSKITTPFKGVKSDLLQANLIGGDCFEYRQTTVSHNIAESLLVVEAIKPKLCMITIEKDPTATERIVCRCIPDDLVPVSSTYGLPLGDGGVMWIRGYQNIKKFRIIGCETGKTHKLHMSFYR